MRVMGLDVGDKTIGVAVSDELGWTAQGLEVIRRAGAKADFDRLGQIIRERGVEEIVVGLPKNMNGTLGDRARSCLGFAGELKERFGLPVQMVDERLSTALAQRVLLEADLSRAKRKRVIDKNAATVILQTFLDGRDHRQT